MTVRSGFKIKEREGVNRLSFPLTGLKGAPTQDFSFLTVAGGSLSRVSRRSQNKQTIFKRAFIRRACHFNKLNNPNQPCLLK